MYDLQTNPITFDEKVKSLVAEDFGINEDELKLALNIIDYEMKENQVFIHLVGELGNFEARKAMTEIDKKWFLTKKECEETEYTAYHHQGTTTYDPKEHITINGKDSKNEIR